MNIQEALHSLLKAYEQRDHSGIEEALCELTKINQSSGDLPVILPAHDALCVYRDAGEARAYMDIRPRQFMDRNLGGPHFPAPKGKTVVIKKATADGKSEHPGSGKLHTLGDPEINDADKVRRFNAERTGHVSSMTCNKCDGTGDRGALLCYRCNGTGRV